MIFFDEKKPNKYNKLKKLLVPFEEECYKLEKEKVGIGDGGYVIPKDNFPIRPWEASKVLSYGIGADPSGVSFELEMLDRGVEVHMYDGSIAFLPVKLKPVAKKLSKFKSEHLTKDNFQDHVYNLNIDNPKGCVLKMDVEGCEYDWLTEENLELLSNNFGVFTIEVHSLIEEVPEGWILEEAIKSAKRNPEKVQRFFEKINSSFFLWHIHGNNHSPRYVDFPDCLELTYLNMNFFNKKCKDLKRCPLIGVDEANFEEKDDYVLDWWI